MGQNIVLVDVAQVTYSAGFYLERLLFSYEALGLC